MTDSSAAWMGVAAALPLPLVPYPCRTEFRTGRASRAQSTAR